jgi:6,7-dimethyl-8-ribityllumazine synthase
MREITASTDGLTHSFPIAIIVSTFNEAITDALKEGALMRLTELGFSLKDIMLVEVPGAVEIPFVAQMLAKKNQVQAIIALGAVIRGETSHYDYVCDQASQGCQRVMLDYDIPVVFGVLTTENEEQAWDRLGGVHGHKGKEVVDCAVVMQQIKQQLL